MTSSTELVHFLICITCVTNLLPPSLSSLSLSPLPPPPFLQVILLFPSSNSLGSSLAQQCQGFPHNHALVTTTEVACQHITQTDQQQNVILVDISPNQIEYIEKLVQFLNTHHLWLQATLVAVVSDSNLKYVYN